jgi:hypothetical protein
VLRAISNLWTALRAASGLGTNRRYSLVPQEGCERRKRAASVGNRDGFKSAMRESHPKKGAQTRGDTTIPTVPGPTCTPSTALTSEITTLPPGT